MLTALLYDLFLAAWGGMTHALGFWLFERRDVEDETLHEFRDDVVQRLDDLLDGLENLTTAVEALVATFEPEDEDDLGD